MAFLKTQLDLVVKGNLRLVSIRGKAMPMHSFISHPISTLAGSPLVAGDKSISHRALMLASQVLGETRIYGLLEGEDVLATAQALRQLGVTIHKHPNHWSVHGVGVGGLKESADVLNMGNSGTSTRLLMGLLAPYGFTSIFTGDHSLNKRPMKRVMEPLSQMGANFAAREGGRLPLAMTGSESLKSITYALPVASAQVKSAVLLAGLNTQGTTTVIEKEPTRDHTENMLQALGFTLSREEKPDGMHISIAGKQTIPEASREIHVPADPSSAAFLIVAALIAPKAELELKNICLNATRTGLLTTLKEMGAQIDIKNERLQAGEKVGDIVVRSSTLKAVRVPASRAPSMIDEYPILAIAAACAEGETVMEGLGELRVKESDRLSAIVAGLKACGIDAKAEGDTLKVKGGKATSGTVQTHYDHRIAMSFLVLGMVAERAITIDDGAAIATSFPNFIPLMNGLGARIESADAAPKRLVIAIDGPAASGKGTLARRLAEHYDLRYLDTGSLYRAVGMKLAYSGQDPNDKAAAIKAAQEIDLDDLLNPRLRQEHIGQAASIISAYPEVRQILLDFQRNVAREGRGAVLDGRDIGTVVCPDADYKFFLTADLMARARRRHKELSGQGVEVVFESVLADLKERDERDAKRPIAPLAPANDAVIVDTSTMDANSVFQRIKSTVKP